jgi:hypothetical protein
MKNNKFAQTLYKMWSTDSQRDKKRESELMKSFLDFGSDTEDNLQCVENIEYGPCKDRTEGPKSVTGLKIKGSNILVSDLVSFLEDDRIYDYLSEEFENLNRDQIESALRMATMVLISLEK